MIKWFSRHFDFNFGADQYAAIYARLSQAPDALKYITAGIAENMLTCKPAGKWSVKENAGHLSVLEPLWRTRFQDIQDSKPELTVADLDNRLTSEAGFNNDDIVVLVERFAVERKTTLLLLDALTVHDGQKTSVHPRLRLPMRVIDLAYFVAEHDDHHLARIRELLNPA